MKSLLLCSRPPWPLHGGDRIRTWHLAKALSALGDVSIVAARGQDEDPSAIEEALSFASSVRLPVLHRRTAALRAASALALAASPLSMSAWIRRTAPFLSALSSSSPAVSTPSNDISAFSRRSPRWRNVVSFGHVAPIDAATPPAAA